MKNLTQTFKTCLHRNFKSEQMPAKAAKVVDLILDSIWSDHNLLSSLLGRIRTDDNLNTAQVPPRSLNRLLLKESNKITRT